MSAGTAWPRIDHPMDNDDRDTAAKARQFQRLHLGPEILVIANAWDAASARVFEQAGIRAVGTGSAGVAFSHGYRDDECIPREVMLRAIGEMVRAVDVPVTADILSGLGDTPEAVAATIREVIALGAAGVNLEDGSDIGGAHLVEVELHCDRVRAACQAARDAGVEIVVNARTDSFWLKLGDEGKRLEASIDRANRYRAAGAHCLFVPGPATPALIATLVKEIAGPLNILAVPGCPRVGELQALGVRRLSEGSGPMRATMMLTRRIARDLIDSGSYARFHDDAIPYPEANALFDLKSPRRSS
ncbi:MAG: isocitrate lyase/phosphoenolpyruvate mutase family protein [Caldimonas sp.]